MTDTTSTDIAVLDETDNRAGSGFDVQSAIQALASGKQTVFSTLQGDDFDTKMQLLEAVTNSVALADNLSKRIDLVNVVIQAVEIGPKMIRQPF